MKILLTGKPGIGKSTILTQVTSKLTIPKYGVIAEEILNHQNERIGFQSKNFQNQTSLFAHKSAIQSDHQIADFFVDINSIDTFVVNEITKGINYQTSILIIDEIGRMQSFSTKFMETLKTSFDNPTNNILSTIVLEPEPWSLQFKQHPQSILIEVNREHQQTIINFLTYLFNNLDIFQSLSQNRRQKVISMANQYAKSTQFIQLEKLFIHALTYIHQNRYRQINPTTFEIQGNHSIHTTTLTTCTCDLYNGKSQYKNHQGICSHIQTIQILQTQT